MFLRHGPAMWMIGWGPGNWWFGPVVALVFWGLVVAGVVWVVRTLAAGGPAAERSRARAILEERFAAGEISEEEFRRMRAVLRER